MKNRRMLATAAVALLIVPLLVVAITERRARHHTGTCVPSLSEMFIGGTQELAVTKLSGVWKYKAPSVLTSEQICVIGGNYETALQSFNNLSPTTFTITTEAYHHYDTNSPRQDFEGFTHTFNWDPAAVKGDGTRYSQKFIDYPAFKSKYPEPKLVKYGTFKARIKDGRMYFIYSIPRANDAGLMVATEEYDVINQNRTQQWFRDEYIKKDVLGGAMVWFRAGPEDAYGEAECDIKVGLSNGKGKLAK